MVKKTIIIKDERLWIPDWKKLLTNFGILLKSVNNLDMLKSLYWLYGSLIRDSPHFVSINEPIFAVSTTFILKVNNLTLSVISAMKINIIEFAMIYDSVYLAKKFIILKK